MSDCITKEDGTVDFRLLTSAERMSYLDGWCKMATGIEPSASDVDGRRRANSAFDVLEADVLSGELRATRRERPHHLMRNIGGIEQRMGRR